MDIAELVHICLKKDLPIALYSLPGKKEILLIISESNVERISFSDLKQKEKGFVLHPFRASQDNPLLFLNADIVVSSEDNILPGDIIENISCQDIKGTGDIVVKDNEDICKNEYLSKVEYLVDRINKGDLSKLVFSRTKTIKSFGRQDLKDLFFKMEEKYKDAFVFLVNIPGCFSWCGATPELLLNSCGEKLNTVALAGTQRFSGYDLKSVRWDIKDIEEQSFVCDHVEEQIRKVGFEYTKTEPSTVRAGSLVHIKTEYAIDGKREKFWDLVSNLHPTPAVCGTPKDKAIDVIEEVENHDRSYYSGFLGPLGIQSEKRLFVNLRCAKYANNSLSLYVGGGITDKSVPEKEWEETELKAETLIKLL